MPAALPPAKMVPISPITHSGELKPQMLTKPMRNVKNTAPTTSHKTTTGTCAPKSGILKKTNAPMAEAIGAVAALMASSKPANAICGVRMRTINAKTNLVMNTPNFNFARKVKFGRSIRERRLPEPLKFEPTSRRHYRTTTTPSLIDLSGQ